MTRAEAFALYAQARRCLTVRQRLGVSLPWPERPESLPEGFGELELAALAQAFRDAWAAPVESTGELVVRQAELSDEGSGWDRIAEDGDVDALLAFVDRRAEEEAGLIASHILRELLLGRAG